MKKSELPSSKIFTLDLLEHLLNIWRFKGEKVVFTNGCFDLIHLGHIDYLSKAADMGSKLIVGLNTDNSVSKIKGPLRPVNNEETRKTVLASFCFVDAVIMFDQPTPIDLIAFIQPDVLVKGADWKKEDIAGYDIVMAKGGTVETITYLDGYSTTALEQKILRNYQIKT